LADRGIYTSVVYRGCTHGCATACAGDRGMDIADRCVIVCADGRGMAIPLTSAGTRPRASTIESCAIIPSRAAQPCISTLESWACIYSTVEVHAGTHRHAYARADRQACMTHTCMTEGERSELTIAFSFFNTLLDFF
jgi:hypothetical protein